MEVSLRGRNVKLENATVSKNYRKSSILDEIETRVSVHSLFNNS